MQTNNSYLICLTIGPAFLSASIYSCLGRIVIVYGESFSRLRPSTYSKIFIPCDIVSLILQAVGGALASTADNQTSLNRGTNIMIGGLSFQVFSLLLFMGLCVDIMLSIHSAGKSGKFSLNPDCAHIRSRGIFTFFLYAIGISTVAIFVRSVFRVAELSKGFHGPLDNQQITYMVLEGVMIILAVTVLTIGHPGWAFDGLWKELKGHKKGDVKEGPWVDGNGSGSGSGSMNGKGQAVAIGQY
jgi:hypothetical protein